ncbi:MULTISPECIES: ABC transporter substrate-binding protein [unclassified Paenibacillus]|uniref:ABC transporter substrate-binding protein n=1 Tax=unclassified Paenibacillus TaxID=185978 RepID=UPI001AE1F15B|nr:MULTISPECIES: ABC transporter substrate-binding protein [unclassified Paenibacillus]MBP1156888.1 NitT/TauT family transport system substrate-binding protein [Paenibacillus sp. PvP091]MBP1172373.1 NitT/TauT family transport system substrate-binding protein [Paenibacillus sp. PvR098]MBP2438754.1 NitT/TauT family transport system substrate-binding protein [Paenibacillus sp. PvP052]
MRRRKGFSVMLIALIALVSVLTACGTNTTPDSSQNASEQNQKTMPDQVVEVNIATVSNTIDFLPWHVAAQKGFFEKHNLKVNIKSVDGGVVALRGLQSGDFQFIASLPESIITAVSEGANVKVVGTLSNKTLFSMFVAPEINKPEDLKGKAVAVLQPGNGVDIITRWWLKQHGLEPDKDVRIVSAGATPARLTALRNGQVQGTLLQPPNDVNGEKAGMKRLAVMSEELLNYNQDVIAANGTVIKDQPEVVRAFMAATAEGISFIKDPANREEAIKIGVESLGTDEEVTTKSFDFALDAIPEKGKLNIEGMQWAIDAVKEIGGIKNDLPVEQVVDDKYYAE